MFDQTFVGDAQTKKPVTVFISFVFQIVLVIVAIIIPLIFTDSLPKTQLTSFLVAPPPPPPPPPPPEVVQQVKPVKVIKRQFDMGVLTAPKEIPKEVAVIEETEMPPAGVGVAGGVAGGVPGGAMGGVLSGIVGSVPSAAPPPPPPPAEKPKPATPQRIRVGGNVAEAKVINRVQPVYPPLAKQARVSGTVRLNAVISRDGTIQDLQVVSGHPLLVQAALQAVRQWRYSPTLLNGEPVEVATVIDVNFTLR
jgi:protein TonB